MLLKDPPPTIILCVSLPPATILTVPIYVFMKAHEELATKDMEEYFFHVVGRVSVEDACTPSVCLET